MGVTSYENPFKELEYVYHDGTFIETMPMQIYITILASKKDEVINYAKSKNLTVYKN